MDFRFRSRIPSSALPLLIATFSLVYSTTPDAQTPPVEANAVALEIFKQALPKEIKAPTYPEGERLLRKEGWVNLNFMVDPTGRPYEIMVADSSGNEVFDERAVKAAKKWTFTPASLNGTPIDSGQTMKVTFRLTGDGQGATDGFIKTFRNLEKAIVAKDKPKADEAMRKLEAVNLYEEAFVGIIEYMYALQWGSEKQQIAGLRRAIAREGRAKYLPDSAFTTALAALLPLEIKNNDFSNAMYTWKGLEESGEKKDLVDKMRPAIKQIEALRTNDKSFQVMGELVGGLWTTGLFKKRFHIKVVEGYISQIKLRCDKKYVFFQFDPELQYRTNDDYGTCTMQVIGDPGTKFALIQS